MTNVYNSTLFDCMKPEIIDFSKETKIKQISCGSYHTLALTEQGEIYGWGDNRFGKIGCGKQNSTKVNLPIKF